METNLAKSQVYRIKQVKAALDEVYPKSLEQWIDGFEKDWRPETELTFWECMAMAYTAFIESHECSAEKRADAMNCLNQHSLGRNEVELFSAGFTHLIEGEIIELVEQYQAACNAVYAIRQPPKNPDLISPTEALEMARVAIRGMLDVCLCHDIPDGLYDFDPDDEYLFAIYGKAIQDHVGETRFVAVSKTTGDVRDAGTAGE